MDETHDKREPKINIAGLYNRVASLYGQVGPDSFSYAGRHLVDHMDIAQGAKVLDVAVGRGAETGWHLRGEGLTVCDCD